MFLSFKDFISIIEITSVLFVSFFAWYFPLRFFLKNSALAEKTTMVLSLSIQIIFGYFFYFLSIIGLYPICYLILILFLNIFAIWKLKPKLQINNRSFGTTFLISLAVVFVLFYNRFFGALTHIAPGTIDTASHIRFLYYDLDNLGYLSFPPYPPGFHILLYPLTKIVSQVAAYRFVGPILGLLATLNIYFLLKNKIKNKISFLAIVALSVAPFFNQLTLQMIGFFATNLTFFFAPFFFYLIWEDSGIKKSTSLSLYAICAIALAFTVPYLIVQTIVVFFVLYIMRLFFRGHNNKIFSVFLFKFFVISLLSFVVAFGHVFLQTKILKRGAGFPSIEIASQNSDSVSLTNNFTRSKEIAEKLPIFLRRKAEKPLIENYILPMGMTGWDIVKVKNIRPLAGYLAIGAYLGILVALLCLILGFKWRRWDLITLSVAVLVFGISVQTGILEMSTYRGRNGFYMMFFFLILIVILFDKFYKRKYLPFIGAGLLVVFASSFFAPPQYYRTYYPEYFDIVNKIIDENKDENITIIANLSDLNVISRKVKVYPVNENFASKCENLKCFVILEKNYLWLDPVLSQRSYAEDKNFAAFNSWQKKTAEDQENLVNSIKNLPDVKKAQIYFENQNLTVYKIEKE